MVWLILKSGGVITDRAAQPIKGDSTILEFNGIGSRGYTVVLKRHDGKKLYAPIEDGRAVITNTFLVPNKYKVSILTLDGETTVMCEGIRIVNTGGAVFIHPDDGDLPSEVVRLRVANNTAQTEMEYIKRRLDKIESRLAEIEGFDI